MTWPSLLTRLSPAATARTLAGPTGRGPATFDDMVAGERFAGVSVTADEALAGRYGSSETIAASS